MSLNLSSSALRHPWLDALVASPVEQVWSLLRGAADVSPYTRAEPDDAAASLLFGFAPSDPALAAFDVGCMAALERLHQEIPAATEARWPGRLLLLDTLFAVLLRIRPPRAIATLHDHYARWFNLVEVAVLDEGLDLRRAFWRVLAVTQHLSPRGAQSRHLMPLWLEICGEAGSRGRYPASYLDVGLLGLRRLPLPDNQDANEEAVCHGLARWAAQQAPDRATFEARWREIEAAYPHHALFWPPLVERVVFATEEHLAERRNVQNASFPAAAWWRELMELPVPRTGQLAARPRRGAPVEPAPLASVQAVLDAIDQPIATLKPRIAALMAEQRRYAEASGDAYYLVRTANNVGMRLLQGGAEPARAALSEELALVAIRYNPDDVHGWALWADTLRERHRFACAEAVEWETIRRFPERAYQLTRAAKLLANHRGRPAEAAMLLRQCLVRFPQDMAVRSHLARLLADHFGRFDQARSLLEEAIDLHPNDGFAYGDLAVLLADHFSDRRAAASVLRLNLARIPSDRIATEMLARLEAGGRLRRPTILRQTAAADDLADPGGFSIASGAEARRALFRADVQKNGAAVNAAMLVLARDPALTYARWALQRLDLGPPAARKETAFAFAFARAAREGSYAAFQALTRDYSQGIDSFVARAGLTLVSGGADFAMPPAANDPAAGSRLHRLVNLLGGLRDALPRIGADRRPLLGLVADFAGSDLSPTSLAA